MKNTGLEHSLSELVLLMGEEKESQKNWSIKSKKVGHFQKIPKKGSAVWSVDLDRPYWSLLNVESITPPMDSFLRLRGLPEPYYIQHTFNYKNLFYKVKDMEENQNYFTYRVKKLEERLKKLENVGMKESILEIKELHIDLENIKNSLNKAIIFRPFIEDVEENRKFIDEQNFIEELKGKYEGEILAFARQSGELKLVAHSLFRNDLMDLIGKAYKSNEISKDTEIFYR